MNALARDSVWKAHLGTNALGVGLDARLQETYIYYHPRLGGHDRESQEGKFRRLEVK